LPPLLRPLAFVFNPLATKIAGSRYLPFWAVLRHRGRHSGRAYATPVVARRTHDGFVIPLPFGEGVDWCRNVLASGGGAIRWSGAEHMVVAPAIIDVELAVSAFHPLEQRLIRLSGIRRFVRLTNAPSSPAFPSENLHHCRRGRTLP
jgi:hypothetical protein